MIRDEDADADEAIPHLLVKRLKNMTIPPKSNHLEAMKCMS